MKYFCLNCYANIVYDIIRLTLNPFDLIVIIINTRCIFIFVYLFEYICHFQNSLTITLINININNFHFNLSVIEYLL